MAIKRLVPTNQAKQKTIDRLYLKLAADKAMGRNVAALLSEINRIENV